MCVSHFHHKSSRLEMVMKGYKTLRLFNKKYYTAIIIHQKGLVSRIIHRHLPEFQQKVFFYEDTWARTIHS